MAVLGNGHIQAIATRLRDARQGEGLFPGLQGVHGQVIAVVAVAGAGIGNILRVATLAGFVSEDATSPPQSRFAMLATRVLPSTRPSASAAI